MPERQVSDNVSEESLAYMEECAGTGLPIPAGWIIDLVATVRRERESKGE